MKTIILTCNTGQGHNSVSAAIKEAFDSHSEDCRVVDALSFLSEKRSRMISNWHIRIYRHMPKLFGMSYKYAEEKPSVLDENSLAYKIIASASDKLYEYLVSESVDNVICSHVICGVLVTDMMRKYPMLKLRTSFVATDYTCSPMTDESRLDRYFISDSSLAGEFEDCGIPAERLVPISGIPVRKSFVRRVKKETAKKRLEIDPGVRHILMMFGSMGCGPISEITEHLSELCKDRCRITVCCGTNRVVFRRLSHEYRDNPNIRVLGYYRNVSLLMDSADVFITKPGGISISEAAVKKLPMVFVNVVSGCEEHNLKFFLDKGMAVTAETPEETAMLVYNIIFDDKRIAAMRASFTADGSAAEQVYEYVVGESGENERKTS